MAEARIRVEVDGAVATIVVSRPEKLNAFDLPMLGELAAACDTVEARPRGSRRDPHRRRQGLLAPAATSRAWAGMSP